jgi:hypothetical protein
VSENEPGPVDRKGRTADRSSGGDLQDIWADTFELPQSRCRSMRSHPICPETGREEHLLPRLTGSRKSVDAWVDGLQLSARKAASQGAAGQAGR